MMTSSIEFGNEEILKQIVNAKVKQNYNWDELKAILVHKFKTIPSELAQYDTKDLIPKCLDKLNFLIETPFTVQRICELMIMLNTTFMANGDGINNENKLMKSQYKSFEKFLNAVYKCLNVTGKCDDNSLLTTPFDTMDTS